MEQAYYGIWGRILRVNLTNGKISIEEPDISIYRTYIGGRTLALYFLLKEIEKGVDPLGPKNKIVFMTSPTTGYPISGQGRHTIASLSPLTGGLIDSQCGGRWGAELKHAGWDGIIIEGESNKPVYLFVHDEEVSILSAEELTGKTTGEVDSHIRSIHKSRISILQNGPAGENLVRYASVTSDLRNFAARGGPGAVMGSKNLRAVAVRGSNKKLKAADPESLKKLASWFAEGRKSVPGLVNLHKLGTSGGVLPSSLGGNLPTYNQQDSSFDRAENLSGELMNDILGVGTEACYSCVFACKRVIEGSRGKYKVTRQYGGPEYESIGSLGSQLGIDDIVAVAEANERCNALGLDTISAGVTISWAVECFQRELLTTEDTEGLELRWNDPDMLLRLLDSISSRESFGNLLAEGSRRASKKIGRGSEKYAMHVKGQELPAHEPRGKWGVALGFGVSPTGADHLQAAHEAYFSISPFSEEVDKNAHGNMSPVGYIEPVHKEDLSPNKIRFFLYHQFLWAAHDVLDWCIIITKPEFNHFGSEHLAEALKYITGWNTNYFEIVKAGERAVTMARAFNCKHGFKREDDFLPDRLYSELRNGALSGHSIDRKEYSKALDLYYGMLGWNEYGIPQNAKLEELGIGWVCDHLPDND